MIIKLLTSVAIASVAFDLSISIAWWATKQVTYKTVNTIAYMLTPA